MSRVSQCHEYLMSGWQHLAMTRDHCSHPQPCSAAVRCCIQITSEKSHLIENNKSLITIREILLPESVLRGWCQYCTHLVMVIIAPLPPDNSSQTWWRLLSSWSPDTSSGSKDGASHFLVEEQLPGLDSRDLCYQLRRASWMFCKNCMEKCEDFVTGKHIYVLVKMMYKL